MDEKFLIDIELLKYNILDWFSINDITIHRIELSINEHESHNELQLYIYFLNENDKNDELNRNFKNIFEDEYYNSILKKNNIKLKGIEEFTIFYDSN